MVFAGRELVQYEVDVRDDREVKEVTFSHVDLKKSEVAVYPMTLSSGTARSGIWSYTDSVYTCDGILQDTDSDTDTLCTGMGIDPDAGDVPVEIVCTGTVTPTSVDVTCNATYDAFENCAAVITVETQATRTGDSYVAETTSSFEYVGTGLGCDSFPTSCTRIVTRANRIAGEPTAYCATPVVPSTWGTVKNTYR